MEHTGDVQQLEKTEIQSYRHTLPTCLTRGK